MSLRDAVTLAWILAVATVLGGCADRACPLPLADAVVAGDANGDGLVDVADPVYLTRHHLGGGPAPVCAGAVDLVPDGQQHSADTFALWYHVATGTSSTAAADVSACGAPSADDPPCGRMRFAIDADPRVEAAPSSEVQFDAFVTLRTRDLAVDAWSLAVSADGCTLASATTAGTLAADTFAEPPGQSREGMQVTEAAGAGHVSTVALGWLTPTALGPSPDPQRILALSVTATAPPGGCTSCTLAFEDGLAGSGLPVSNRAVHAGRSYAPARTDAEIKVCTQ